MRNYKYSIIIPTYNAEKYILDCLNSVLKQTYHDYEVIIIDDGSTDQTANLIRDFIKNKNQYTFIRLVHNGVCKARNIGIEISSGDYICFLDADDCVYPDYLAEINNQAPNDYDVIYFKYTYGMNHKRRSKTGDVRQLNSDDIKYLSVGTLYHTKEVDLPNGKYYGINSFSAGMQVYKRKLFLDYNIRYTEGIIRSEDGLLNLQVLSHCNTGCIIDKELYIYRLDNNSVTRSYNKDLAATFFVRDQKVKETINSLSDEDKSLFWNSYYCSLIYQIRIICENSIFNDNNKQSISQKIAAFKDLISRTDYKNAISIVSNMYLLPADKRYLRFCQKENALFIILYIKFRKIKNTVSYLCKQILIGCGNIRSKYKL